MAAKKPKIVSNVSVLLVAKHFIGGVVYPKGTVLENYSGPVSRNMKIKTAAKEVTGDPTGGAGGGSDPAGAGAGNGDPNNGGAGSGGAGSGA